ncbi:hypothetical protein Tco_0663345 [Tanacetum coccineum]
MITTSYSSKMSNVLPHLNGKEKTNNQFILPRLTGLTAVKALESIQERADHSRKWNNKESHERTSNKSFNSLSTITDKLKNLNQDMSDLGKNVHEIHQKTNKEFRHEEIKSIRTRDTKQDSQAFTKPLGNLEETFT